MSCVTDAAKDEVFARLQRMVDEAADEKQRDRDAALWRAFARINPETAAKLALKFATEQ